jgi:Na+/H+ antiporter NhaD/arsenite permease-like protein
MGHFAAKRMAVGSVQPARYNQRHNCPAHGTSSMPWHRCRPPGDRLSRARRCASPQSLRMLLNAASYALLFGAATLPCAAAAATEGAFTGVGLPSLWGLPFAGLLLSLALWPLFAADFWHHHYGKITAVWGFAFLVPFTISFGPVELVHQVVHALMLEYLPFVILLFSLYTIAGGISVRGTLVGTPALNTGILALGAMLASLMGTTGAAMLLIRPLLRANEGRRRPVHIVVFFIILVANVGGALSPLGDPPLFIGFLKGIDFFWTTRALAMPTFMLAGALLVIFFALDSYFWRSENVVPPAVFTPLGVDGAFNFALLAGVVGGVLLSGIWKPGVALEVAGTPLEIQNLARDAILVALALLSLALTPKAVREANAFKWEPIAEVAKLFAGIFLTIIPVIAMLHAGRAGPLAAVVDLVTDNTTGQPRQLMYFWMTGLLSAFLDNAPTYLVFFNLCGGDPAELMGPLKTTLAMISAGAVYFGALTYVGNAPNFMVKAIAESGGVKMPSFFAYFGYAAVVLLPLFAIISWIYS